MSRITRFAKALVDETKDLPGGHPAQFQSPWFQRWGLGRNDIDTSGVGDGSQNSIVVAALNVLVNGFAEAPLTVQEQMDKDWEAVPDHPFNDLWGRPNQFMDDYALITYITTATRLDGNAYMVKVRNPFGEVIELWPLIPEYTEPKTFDDQGGGFIDFYEYVPRGTPVRYDPTDIIHIKYGLDPTNHRKGMSPLKAGLREIKADEEASRFSTALLSNTAVGSYVLIPAEAGDPGPTEPQADAIKEKFVDTVGGRNRGAPLVMTGNMRLERISFSPSELNLRELRRLPEERVTALLGVPAILAQLGAGLDRSTLNNVKEAGEMLTERTLVPGWRHLEKQLANQLDEFDFGRGLRPRFDLTEVKALQEDTDRLYQRLSTAVQGGWLTVADARRAVGMEVEEWHDVFLRGAGQMEVENEPVADDEVTDDEPVGSPNGNGQTPIEELQNIFAQS